MQSGTTPEEQKKPRKQQGTEDRGGLEDNPKPDDLISQKLWLIWRGMNRDSCLKDKQDESLSLIQITSVSHVRRKRLV